MKPALEYLGISQSTEDFFAESFSVEDDGSLMFPYGEQKKEIYGVGKHFVPKLAMPWIANNVPLEGIRHVYITESAIESICFAEYLSRRDKLINVLFVSLGKLTYPEAIHWVCQRFTNSCFRLVFPNTVLGKVLDCRIAARLHNKSLRITHNDQDVNVEFRGEVYKFNKTNFSLDAFKKATNLSLPNVRTHKPPKGFNTFLDYFLPIK